MGYTHYFYSKLNKEQIISSMDDIEKIIKNATDENGFLAGGKVGNPSSFDEQKDIPICNRERGVINFNGDVNLKLGVKYYWDSELNHENFVMSPFVPSSFNDDGFNFCKTAQKPYDKLVVATLFHLGFLFPKDFNWSSDGNLIEDFSVDENEVYIDLSDELKDGFQLVWKTFHENSEKDTYETLKKLFMPLRAFKELEEEIREATLEKIVEEWID